jgi:hypothetical protein
MLCIGETEHQFPHVVLRENECSIGSELTTGYSGPSEVLKRFAVCRSHLVEPPRFTLSPASEHTRGK